MAQVTVGIRREDKNQWERRVPLTPACVRQLGNEAKIAFVVQPSPLRVFSDDEYSRAGARVSEDLSPARIVIGVKEFPKEIIAPGKVYVFFSHTIKGQPDGMPLLRAILDAGATLIDYERIVDDDNKRLVFFGVQAGYAGMVDALHLLGRRRLARGEATPFTAIRMTHTYRDLKQATDAVSEAGARIRQSGVGNDGRPFVVGIAGYGNVSKGAQHILEFLPTEAISPDSLLSMCSSGDWDDHKVYQVVFREEHTVEADNGSPFNLTTYCANPERYHAIFRKYLPYLTIFVNAIYWTKRFPRLVTKADLRAGFQDNSLRGLEIIADLSIDIAGAVECSYRSTDPGNPSYVYEPLADKHRDGVAGDGPAILAVDNLPCEIPRESSQSFSDVLGPFIAEIAKADWSKSFEDLALSQPIKKAIIVHQGSFPPDYAYLSEFVRG